MTPALQNWRTASARATHDKKASARLFLLRVFLFQYLSFSSTHAQITLDGSLGPKGALAGPNYTIDANVGKQVGGNLFHSFGEFKVNTAESATFTGPNTVDNIIGRVTGGNPSLIDGTIRSTIPDANLYLVNPSGVLFGPNASLDVGGSFHMSTADYLKLGENGRFDAITLSDSLLTSAPPEAFGFLAPNPAPISIQGSQLAVPEGKALSVVGGDLQITGGKLFAPSGQINLASVASSGEVIPNTPGQSADLHVASFSRLGRIEMSDGANIQSSGQAGGSVVIRGGQLLMTRSIIGTVTLENIDGSTIGIDIQVAGEVTLNGASLTTQGHGTGRVGNVAVQAEKIRVSGSSIDSRTFSTARGGTVQLTAIDSITISDPGSSVSSATFENNNSGAGDILISTPILIISNDGFIANVTFGKGNAGSINIEAERVSLTSGTSISGITFSTGQGSSVTIKASDSIFISGHDIMNPTFLGNQTVGSGDAGRLQISTPTLRMDGGILTAGTGGAGRGGNLVIDVERANLTGGAIIDSSAALGSSGHGGTITFTASDSITITGSGPDGSPNLISSITGGSGNAGRIFLSTPELTMSQGEIATFASADSTGRAGDIELYVGRATLTGTGQPVGSSQFPDRASINSASQATGQGGQIRIIASDSVVLSGPGVEVLSEADGSGAGGAINLHAKDIQLTDGATISSKSTATGDAGNITILATDTFRSEHGTIATAATSENGGNIILGAGSLAHLSDSQITATVAGGRGNGGNITIEPTSTVLNRSTITANAFGGPGGNVRITSDVFLASPDSSVTASSALGVDGLVDIQSPITSISGSFAPLPETFVNTSELLPVRCAARLRNGQSSSFVVRGRDALPPTPDGALPSPLLRRDKTNTVGSSAATVSGWDEAGLSQVNVEVDCLK